MTVRLNFGLARNDGAGFVNADDVLAQLAAFYLGPVAIGVVASDTEPTLIVDVAHTPTESQVATLCERFAQDCFAAWSLRSASGALLGPKAAEWGPFNPEFFILTRDGERLAPRAANYPLEV